LVINLALLVYFSEFFGFSNYFNWLILLFGKFEVSLCFLELISGKSVILRKYIFVF